MLIYGKQLPLDMSLPILLHHRRTSRSVKIAHQNMLFLK